MEITAIPINFFSSALHQSIRRFIVVEKRLTRSIPKNVQNACSKNGLKRPRKVDMLEKSHGPFNGATCGLRKVSSKNPRAARRTTVQKPGLRVFPVSQTPRTLCRRIPHAEYPTPKRRGSMARRPLRTSTLF